MQVLRPLLFVVSCPFANHPPKLWMPQGQMTGHPRCFPATKGVRASGPAGLSVSSRALRQEGAQFWGTLRANTLLDLDPPSPILSRGPIGTALLVQWLHLRPLPVDSATSYAFPLDISRCPCSPSQGTRADSRTTRRSISTGFSFLLSSTSPALGHPSTLIAASCTTLRVFNILS